MFSGPGTRCIDQVLNLAELSGDVGRRTLHGSRVCHIHLLSAHRTSGVAIKFCGDITNRGVDVPESNVGPFCGKGSCDCMPDPLGGTDDDSIVTRELKVHLPAPSRYQD